MARRGRRGRPSRLRSLRSTAKTSVRPHTAHSGHWRRERLRLHAGAGGGEVGHPVRTTISLASTMFIAVCRPRTSRRERSRRPRHPRTGGPSPTGRSGSAEFDDLPLPSPIDFGTPRPIRFRCGSKMVDLQGDCHRQPPGNRSETARRGRLHGQGTTRTGPRAAPMAAGRCGVAASSAPFCGSVSPKDGTKHGRRQESSGTRDRIGETNRTPRPA